jgi:hypothetical protein
MPSGWGMISEMQFESSFGDCSRCFSHLRTFPEESGIVARSPKLFATTMPKSVTDGLFLYAAENKLLMPT